MERIVLKIDGSFALTAQIPDNTVGCSGSRCASCKGATAYCEQICRNCGLPFIGPAGFPQWEKWLTLSTEKKHALMVSVYRNGDTRGRLGYANVAFVPLNQIELVEIEKLEGRDVELFNCTHEVHPHEFRRILV